MGPKRRAQCLCGGPEQSLCAASGSPGQEPCPPCFLCGPVLGQDHVDGQILGQLRPPTEEEEAEGARAASPREPAFPEMGSEELRLASFYDWPPTTGVQPELLAAAGFFHTGQQDKVRCFFCYGGLQSWERGDDPWTEHAKWFPRCQFLLRSKGRGFVHSVQEACSTLLSSWDRWAEPEDAIPAAPADAGGGQQWPAWSQSPDAPASPSPLQLMASLLQEEGRGRAARARDTLPQGAMAPRAPPAPVHGGPELRTPRRETQPEDTSEAGAARDPAGAGWARADGGPPWGWPAPISRTESSLAPAPPQGPRQALRAPVGSEPPGAGSLQEQLQRLQEERRCKVCLDGAVAVVFVPCGHLVCAECAPNLQLCPICRAPIRSCVRTFLS